MSYEILRGDCLAVLKILPDSSFDSIVTDPPYELGFMGKAWDASGIANSVEMWREALRVLKPGGHLLAFSGSRTYHRMTCAIEDAGFEVRDQIMWVYGSGFPKSLDVSKAIDKARDDRDDILCVTTFMADAAEQVGLSRADVDAAMGTSDMGGWWLSRLRHRCQCPKWEQWLQLKVLLALGDEMDAEVWRLNGRKGTPGNERADREVSAPANNEVFQPTQRVINAGTPVLDAARQWEGWGTALKPAHEPICVARKPLIGTVAANVLAHGVGGLNIDGCRVGDEVRFNAPAGNVAGGNSLNMSAVGMPQDAEGRTVAGRWPANLIHDGSDEVLAAFPDAKGQQGDLKETGRDRPSSGRFGDMAPPHAHAHAARIESETSAARFFYCAKASKSDRGPGNTHPTVKPLALMRYLLRLVTPPGGRSLDIFAGSGSTIVAGLQEGFVMTGIELTPEYADIAESRAQEEYLGDLI